MIVRFDITVATSALGDGVLSGLPVGANQIVYVDVSNVSYVGETFVGGSITTTAVQHIVVGATVGNATFNRISLTTEKYLTT